MAIEYRNRKGETYYLYSGRTKKGQPHFHFSRQLKENTHDEMPAGYEIYEHPESAQVYLRKVRPSQISQFERDLLADAIRRLAGLQQFAVDVQGDAMVVYLPNTSGYEVDRIIQMLASPSMGEQRRAAVRAEMIAGSQYSPVMRFALFDANERLYCLWRWCFLGSIDDWHALAAPAPLTDLIDHYVPHLDKESFFDLM